METIHSLDKGALDAGGIDVWFDNVFDETKDWILRYIIVHMDDPTQADDVFQEVYSKLYERIRRRGFRDIQDPIAFLTKMAKREISHHWRKTKSKEHFFLDDEAWTDLPSPEASFEDMIVDRAVLERIRDTVRRMHPLTYKVFVLHYYFDLPITTIAEEIGTTVDAVKSRLSRARAAVRRECKEEI